MWFDNVDTPMSRGFDEETAVLPSLLLGLVLLLFAPLAIAQSNLGELLDAGATKLSVDEFKQELVQHTIVGPTATGGNIEVMYVANGVIHGVGTHPFATGNVGNPFSPISGEWKVDENGKICTRMQIGTLGGVMLPFRCQFWFKHDKQYFLADSDSDRSERVLSRTIKK